MPRAGPGLTHHQGTPSSLVTSHSPTQTPGAPFSDNRFPEALLLILHPPCFLPFKAQQSSAPLLILNLLARSRESG